MVLGERLAVGVVAVEAEIGVAYARQMDDGEDGEDISDINADLQRAHALNRKLERSLVLLDDFWLLLANAPASLLRESPRARDLRSRINAGDATLGWVLAELAQILEETGTMPAAVHAARAALAEIEGGDLSLTQMPPNAIDALRDSHPFSTPSVLFDSWTSGVWPLFTRSPGICTGTSLPPTSPSHSLRTRWRQATPVSRPAGAFTNIQPDLATRRSRRGTPDSWNCSNSCAYRHSARTNHPRVE